ncbi:MAG: DUF3293 domain-containing protein [Luteimonas sp.]
MPMPISNDRLNGLLEAYLTAEYRWERDGQWLALVVGKPAPELDDAFPEARQFGTISAWNPYSVVRQDQFNREADAALHAMLAASGSLFQPAFAAARNRSWKESSWLIVDMPLPEFDALSRRFGQLGTLCWQRGQPVRLRMDAARPATASDLAFVDWLK